MGYVNLSELERLITNVENLFTSGDASLSIGIAPSDYSGNVLINSITGVAVDTMATGAKKVRIAVAKVTGSPGALYVAFGATAAAAVANMDATSGSEAGMLIALTPSDGDEYIFPIPAAAVDGGSLAAGTTGYSNGVNELTINIVQGA